MSDKDERIMLPITNHNLFLNSELDDIVCLLSACVYRYTHTHIYTYTYIKKNSINLKDAKMKLKLNITK